MTGNNLILDSQINSLIPSLKSCELFCSIQSFDKDANTLYTPIYADLDGPTATEDCLDIVETIEGEFDITPEIYFSGSKGYHLIIPFKIVHASPHEIVKRFFGALGHWNSLDHKVFTARRLFRACGSIHHKTGLYKTKITKEELAFLGDEIRGVCTKQVFEKALNWIDNELVQETIEDIKETYVKDVANKEKNGHQYSDYQIEISPCIKKIITTRPQDGEWNHTISTIARFFNYAKVDKNAALNILMNFPHWREDEKHVGKVFNSIFRRDSFYTCRGNETLEQYCDPFCMFSKVDICPF